MRGELLYAIMPSAMLSLGVDIIEVARIKRALERRGQRFLERVYTEREAELYSRYPASLAARFAAKEAVIKALGRQVGWKQIEILNDASGKPHLRLQGQAQERAQKLGLTGWEVSLSHCREYALAVVVAEGNEAGYC